MQANLEQLIADGVIDEVLGRLKSGKEADVYLVRHRGEVVAAKVYKDRDQRNFKNNSAYKEGRQIRNSRTRRAVEKGSRFGKREEEESWKSAEADALYRLHAEGVRVPTPKMFYEGVLLMQLVTDAQGEPAPRLIDAPIGLEAASEIYRDLRRALIGMLCCDLIHGDLSPYNVLFGGEGAIIIDFPQMMSAAHNNRAEFYFRRDFENIHRFLANIDPSLHRARGEGHEIWRAYLRRELSPDYVPSGIMRMEAQVERRPAPPPRPDGRTAFQPRFTPQPAAPEPARPHHAGAGFPGPNDDARRPWPQGQARPRPQPSQPAQPRFAQGPSSPQTPPSPERFDRRPSRGEPMQQGGRNTGIAPDPSRGPGNARPNPRGPNRVVVPEVVYLRRQANPDIPAEPAHAAPIQPREHEPAPHHAPQPPRPPPQQHPSQQHRQQHRAPHQPHAPPPHQPSPGYRGGGSFVEQAPQAEVRDSSDRKGPRRRRRGRRFD